MQTAKTLIRLGIYAQTDLSLCWVHSHIVGFVMWRLIYVSGEQFLQTVLLCAFDGSIKLFQKRWVFDDSLGIIFHKTYVVGVVINTHDTFFMEN